MPHYRPSMFDVRCENHLDRSDLEAQPEVLFRGNGLFVTERGEWEQAIVLQAGYSKLFAGFTKWKKLDYRFKVLKISELSGRYEAVALRSGRSDLPISDQIVSLGADGKQLFLYTRDRGNFGLSWEECANGWRDEQTGVLYQQILFRRFRRRFRLAEDGRRSRPSALTL